MATGHTPCGSRLPQDCIDWPGNMQRIRDDGQRAEALGDDRLWGLEQLVGDVPMLEPVTL